jgi:DnaJ-class molecular chaperone
MDFYAVLGIARDADPRAVRRAWRGLARRYHPDAGEGSSAARFREVMEAYETLGHPERRRAYDRTLAAAPRLRPRVEPINPSWAPAAEVRVVDEIFDDLMRELEQDIYWNPFRWGY